MATNGTCHEGVDNILITAYTGLFLELYTSGNPFDAATVFADMTVVNDLDSNSDPTGYTNGGLALTGVWASTNSVITYDHGSPDDPVFTNTGLLESWQTILGAVITDQTYVLHFMDFGNPIILGIGASLTVDISSLLN